MGTSHRAVQLSGPRSSIISEKSSSSTTTMGKGNNEGGFSQEQIGMYKECFKLMDVDKDGTLSKNDLRAAFDNVGKLMDESELDSMLGEVGGSRTFDAMVKMFQEKMAGGTNDPDDLIVRAFKAYGVVKEEDGKKAIEAEMFRHALTHFGDVFNKAEVDDVFNEFEVDDDGYIESKVVIGLFAAGGGEEKKEEEPAKEEAPPAEEEAAPADDGGKKKKKKKKAAKENVLSQMSQFVTMQQRMPPADKQQPKRIDFLQLLTTTTTTLH